MSLPENSTLSTADSTTNTEGPPLVSPLRKKLVNFAPYCSPNEFIPPPLEGFAYASIDDRFYIFGGSDLNGQETADLFSFSLKSGWQQIAIHEGQAENEKPTPRVAAAMTSCNSKLYLFGGINEKLGWLNDFYEFDTETSLWKRVLDEDQDGPTPRDKCALVASRDKIYLYGGFGPRAVERKNSDSDDEQLDQSSLADNATNGGDVNKIADGVVSEHAQENKNGDNDEDEAALKAALKTANNNQVAAEFEYFNDFYCFDPSTGKWCPVEIDQSTASPDSAGDHPRALVPPGLASYTVAPMADKLLYFGGKTSAGERTNLVYCFALGLKKWLQLNIKDDVSWPVGRSFHSSAVVHDRYLITFGGRGTDDWERDDLWLWDMNTSQWMLAQREGVAGVSSPCARYGHVMIVLPDADSRQHVVIYGGSAELDPASGVAQDLLTDMYVVPVDELIQACAPVIGDEDANKEASHQHHLLHHHRAGGASEEGSNSSGDEPKAPKIPRCDDCIDL